MKSFLEWVKLQEISSNLLSRAADAAEARGDMKGDRLQSKFLRGAESAAERAKSLPRGRSWLSDDIASHPNSHVLPDYSSIKYFFRGEGGKVEEGSFVIRTIKYNPSYGDWMDRERKAAWARTHGPDGSYIAPSDASNPSKSGRMPDYRAIYEIETTKGENIEVIGMAEAATMWQMGEAPRHLEYDNRLQLRLGGKDIFPDRNGAVELSRQINKFDYEQLLSGRPGWSKPKNASEYKAKGIKPEFIKQA